MSGPNSFGRRLILTTFGESHGAALGAVIDGVPAGIKWSDEILLRELSRRRPGSSSVVSARAESDRPEILSGVFEGRTLGTPIAIIVRNQDARSSDYAEIERNPRAGHADDVWKTKFGHTDPRGGGRSSGRETLSRVIGGSVARMVLAELAPKLLIKGFAQQIGPFALDHADSSSEAGAEIDPEKSVARFPARKEKQSLVERLLTEAKAEGKSYGGTASIQVTGVPVGLGQPVFHKLKADLASAFLGVGAASAIEIGAGSAAVSAEGSEFHTRTETEVYGGIRGGISTGDPLSVKVLFKPTSSVLDIAKKGRHDPCIVPRAIPVLEAMAALVLTDHLLWARTDQI